MSGPVDVLAVLDEAIPSWEDGCEAKYRNDLREVRAAVAELIEAAQEVVDGTVNATTYPDGPCIDRSDRERLTAAIARVQGVSA